MQPTLPFINDSSFSIDSAEGCAKSNITLTLGKLLMLEDFLVPNTTTESKSLSELIILLKYVA